ncbi:UvrD-like helicase ATP-binding domain-containing protein [Mycena chlorophos]|uniref:UvrD-like helicase ATP-binding domain-containing protein n=1 Tax=Mycena chlorophos TaxID=658473 RepID=A0A8H6WFB5_MYCCL|nr:UvrD-like helicase ATP-binding domain-containing protein [Mycena chlorophos]
MAAPRKLPYRADLFAFSTTSTVEQVEDVMLEFGGIVNAANVDRILRDVIDYENGAAARLAIAAVEPQLLLDAFPSKPQDFKASLAALILAQLSFFFVHLDKIHSLREHHFQIRTDALDLLAFVAERLEAESAAPTNTKRGKPIPLFEVQLRTRRNTRRATTTNDASSKAADAFQRLGIDPPNSIRELERAQELILVTQKSILEAYLNALQLPAVLESLRIGCIPTMEAMPQPETVEDGAQVNDAEAGAAVDIQLDNAEALPVFGTVKFSTIYRKRVKGFGDWDINVAPQAEQDLRALRKRDPGLFSRLVKTTLRALSNGDFSPSNQERVNVGEFPIFKVHFEDFAVVYHVDCVPLDDTNDQQAIKIFGLYTDGQVTATFWESMGRELAKRGSSYVERCARRQHDASKEDRFVPAVFPAATIAGEKTEPQLPTDDTEQILSLLLKTVHFSQHVLDSILKDIDATFVLEISPEECKIVEHDFSCYVFGRSGTGKTTTMLYKMLLIEASSLDSATRPVRQLFVTQSRTLADKVGEHFTHLLGGYRPAAVARNLVASKLADTALLARTERDKLRSDLPKRYSELQDRDFPLFVSFEQLCSMLEQDVAARLSDENAFKRDYLNFDKFKNEYWPHFAQSLTKGFDAMTIYSQIMGVIKGSEAALRSKRSYLDREGYMAANSKRAVASDQKSRTYDLFERYLAEKKRRGDLDVADRTRLVLSHFREHGVAGQKIDCLYVDEVQDNLLIDLLLLRSICHNPNGLFWAGDTAQTINAGSAFRFKELKAFMYTVEQGRKSKHPEHAFLPATPPKVFQLTTNYRSHTGIVNCARTLVDTITKLWPDSIDKLEPERGTVEGLIPIFFNSWEAETTEANQFLFGAETSGGRIDFGAHQCILVRDKAARDKLLRDVGEVAIILPVYDAKGLEFNDILLYNFFADSHVDEAQWRVVLNMLEGVRAPPLDALRHGAVCTELKFLYVAVTRARNNLWIADCSTKGEAMRPKNGEMCFERARMPLQAHVCEAYELMQDALEVAHKSPQQKANFVFAGNAFLECARQTEGSSVSEDYASLAGKCFEDAGERRRAIDAYMLAGDFGKVANLYRRDSNFDDALRIIREHPEIDSKIIATITRTARVSFIHKRQFKKAVEFKLFDDSQDAVGYLSELGLHEERAQVLEEVAEQPSAAAEVHLQEGRLLKAIELFVADKNFERATACVIQGLWEALPFAATALSTDDNVSQLLKFAAQLEALSIKPIEFSMFRAIVNEDVDVLRVLGRTFHESNNAPSALLCLDHYFTRRFDVRHLDADPLVQHLELFLIFVKRLYAACFEVDPAAVAGAGRLFGYAREGEDRFLIQTNSVLHPLTAPNLNDAVVVSAHQLRWAYQTFIRDRLVAHVRRENLSCGGNKIFEGPCLTYALFNGRCNRGDCQQEHLDPASLTPEGYTLRVRAHVIQILIFQMQQFERSSLGERSFWLSRLYSILNPPSHALGSSSSLRRIPEVADGLRVIADWLRDRAYALDFDPRTQIRFLTRLMETTQLSFHFQRDHALEYFKYAPFMVNERKPLIYRRPPEGKYIVAEFLSFLEDADKAAISAGVIFLNHVVVRNKLPIRIGLLCDIADNICGRLIIADRQRRGVIHDITLPLSWLVRQVAGGLTSFVQARELDTCWIFARVLVALLDPVLSGVNAGHLIFQGNRDLNDPRIGFVNRNMFLARLLRCLGLRAFLPFCAYRS